MHYLSLSYLLKIYTLFSYVIASIESDLSIFTNFFFKSAVSFNSLWYTDEKLILDKEPYGGRSNT